LSAIPSRINIVTLGVDNLALSESFYIALGWQRSSASQDGVIAWFKLNGAILGLFPYADLAADATIAADPKQRFNGVTLAINLESQEAVDAALSHAKSCGAELIKPASMAVFGVYSGYFADPDGYLWEIAWNPFFEQDADGTLQMP
jgi:hypothetical protein